MEFSKHIRKVRRTIKIEFSSRVIAFLELKIGLQFSASFRVPRVFSLITWMPSLRRQSQFCAPKVVKKYD